MLFDESAERTHRDETTAASVKNVLLLIALLASCTPSRTAEPASHLEKPLGGSQWEPVPDVPPILPVLSDFAMSCGPATPGADAGPEEGSLFARVEPGRAPPDEASFPKVTDASVTPPAATAGGDPSIVILLHRTECYGTCPSYRVMLKGDGTFVYVGNHFVNARGRIAKHCNPADVATLADRLERLGYFSLNVPTDCKLIATDGPSAWTSVTYRGRTRTIRHYDGNGCMPKQLEKIEDEIDRAAGTATLVACPSGCKR